jgi:hypothetical protein
MTSLSALGLQIRQIRALFKGADYEASDGNMAVNDELKWM